MSLLWDSIKLLKSPIILALPLMNQSTEKLLGEQRDLEQCRLIELDFGIFASFQEVVVWELKTKFRILPGVSVWRTNVPYGTARAGFVDGLALVEFIRSARHSKIYSAFPIKMK